MARGWESKSIESQQEEVGRHQSRRPLPTADELARRDRQRALELARSRATADLARATQPAHRQMLERAIASLDQQIATLGD